MKAMAWKAIASFTIAILVPVFASADVLYLKNGDRITGTIKRIWDDEVTIEPEYSDEFQVDLPLVERIESDRDFEIEMPDGTDVLSETVMGSLIIRDWINMAALLIAQIENLCYGIL